MPGREERSMEAKSILLRCKDTTLIAPMVLKRLLKGKVVTPSVSREVSVEFGGRGAKSIEFEITQLVVKGLYYEKLSGEILAGYIGDVIVTDATQVVLATASDSSDISLRGSESMIDYVVPMYPRLALECVSDKVSTRSLIGHFSSLYKKASHGSALVFGLSGTGKSTVTHGLAQYFNMPHFVIKTCELFAHSSNTESAGGVGGGGEYADLKLVSWCNRAIALQVPCVLCIDDLENIAPPNGNKIEADEMTAAVMKRVVELVRYCDDCNQRLARTAGSADNHMVGAEKAHVYARPFIWVLGVYNVSRDRAGAAGPSRRTRDGEDAAAGSRCLPQAIQKLFPERFEMSATFPESEIDRQRVIEGVYCAFREGVELASSPAQQDSRAWGYHASDAERRQARDGREARAQSDRTALARLQEMVQQLCPSNRKLTAINYAHTVVRAVDHLFVRSARDPASIAALAQTTGAASSRGDEDPRKPSPFEVTGIFGHSEIRQQLHDAIVLPAKYHHHFKKCHLNMEIGVLLYGPPGTGKTLLVKSVAAQLRYNLVCIRLTDIIKGEVGTGEAALIDVFQQAKRNHPPCIVFIDEFQALFTAKSGDRESTGSTLTPTLMSCLDDIVTWNSHAGAQALVSVIAATNEPWAIDASFLRPGRFDRCILVGSLDKEARRGMLVAAMVEVRASNHNGGSTWAEGAPAPLSDFEVDFLVNATDGYTGADVSALIRKCKITCIDKAITAANGGTGDTNQPMALTFDCWLTALHGSGGTVSASLKAEYESWSHK